jgi:peptidoglycan glycosyltransferase
MAMVAAAVANGGKLMDPRLSDKVVDPDGRTVQTFQPTEMGQVMSAKTASEVNQMMRTVVDEGTGTPAKLGSGIPFAGKTGTASIGPTGAGETQPWFIGFAPADNPKVAVAVTIEKTQGQFGGQVAAPIARDIVQTLLSEGK